MTEDGVTIRPAKLELSAACNVESAPSSITLENGSDKAVPYEIHMPESGVLAIKGGDPKVASGTVEAGKIFTVNVVAVAAPAPATLESSVIVTTNGKDQSIPASVLSKGATLKVTPKLTDFGQVRQNTTIEPRTLELENTGNEPVNVSGWTGGGANPGDFMISGGSIVVAPNAKQTATVTFQSGQAGPAVSATFTPTTTDPTCTPVEGVEVKGERVSSNVIVSTGSIDFGTVDCNSNPNATRTVTISNYSPTPANVSIALGNPAFVLSETIVTVPAGSTGNPSSKIITVSLAQPIGATPGPQATNITFSITGPETVTRTVSATMRIEGAVVTVSPTTLTGFSTTQTKKTFRVQNVGDGPISLNVASSSGDFAVTSGVLLGEKGSFFPSESANMTVELKNTNAGMHNATITLTRESILSAVALCSVSTVQAQANIP